MEVKKIVEGMTAPQVAQVIDENFNALNGEKATVEAVADVQKNVNRSDDNTGILSYPVFDDTEPVAVGDVRRYEGLLYRAKEAGAHDWDTEKWERVTLKQLEDEKLSELGSEVSILNKSLDSFSRIATASYEFSVKGYVNAQGILVDSDVYQNTGIIKVSRNSTVHYKAAAKTYPIVLFYDKDVALISNLTIIGNGESINSINLSSDEYKDVTYILINNRTATTVAPYAKIEGDESYVEKIKDIQEKIEDGNIDLLGNIYQGNAFNYNGYTRYSDGQFIENDMYVSTDYIPLNPNNVLIVRKGHVGESSSLVTFFDSKKMFIVGVNNASEVNYEPNSYPTGAAYFRCCTNVNSKSTITVVNHDIVDISMSISKLQIDQEVIKQNVNTIFPMIYDKYADLTIDGYITSSGAISVTANAKRTDYIPIKPYDMLEWGTNITATASAVAFYDKEHNFLPDLVIVGANGYSSGIVDLTEEKYVNVEYVVVSYYDKTFIYKDFILKLYSKDSFSTKIEKTNRQIESIINVQADKEGLNILIFGDSITTCADIQYDSNRKTTSYVLKKESNWYADNNGDVVRYSMWPYLLTELFKCYDVRNYAIEGASFKDLDREVGNERQNLSFQIDMAINDIPNENKVFPTDGNYTPDIVIFALGTNDGVPNDTYDSAMSKTVMDGDNYDVDATIDSLDWSKFSEAARAAFMRIHKAFPYAQKFCVLPIQRQAREQQTGGVNDDLKKMAERYSIVVIDGATELGVVRDFEKKNALGLLLKDGLHPNDAGQKMFARMVSRYIKQYTPII